MSSLSSPSLLLIVPHLSRPPAPLTRIMSSWVPMDINVNIMEIMAQQQGIELPPQVINPPQAPPPASSLPAVSTSRSSLSSFTSDDLMSKVDLTGGLVSTRRRPVQKSPVKEKQPSDPDPLKEPDDDDFLYDDDSQSDTNQSNDKNLFRGSQYLDEPLDPDEEDSLPATPDPVSDEEPIDEVEEPAAVPLQQEESPLVPVSNAPEVIPLLDDEDDDLIMNYNDDMIEEKKRPFLSQPEANWESEIPGLGSPIRDQQPDDPVVDSVVEHMTSENQDQESRDMEAEETPAEDEERIGEEEDEIGNSECQRTSPPIEMDVQISQEPDAHDLPDDDACEEAEETAFSMVTAMFSPKKSPSLPVPEPESAAAIETVAPADPPVSLTTACPEQTPQAAESPESPEESEESSPRVTRSATRGSFSSSPSKSLSPSASAAAVPPVKIRIVPVSSGVVYQVKPNDPQAMKVVIKKTNSAPSTAPTAHPIIVEKKTSPLSSSSSGKTSQKRESSSPSSAAKKKKAMPAAGSGSHKSEKDHPAPQQQQPVPQPCLNCGKPSVSNKLWDSEYCSHQCVFYYVKKVFQKMFPPKEQKQRLSDAAPLKSPA